MKIVSVLLILLLASVSCSGEKDLFVTSPDGKVKLTLIPEYESGDVMSPAITVDILDRQIISPSLIRISADDNVFEGNELKVIDIERESVTNQLDK